MQRNVKHTGATLPHGGSITWFLDVYPAILGTARKDLAHYLGATTNMKGWHTNLIPKASKSFGIGMLRDRTYSSMNAEEPDVHTFSF
jgi:hypothetical protein